MFTNKLQMLLTALLCYDLLFVAKLLTQAQRKGGLVTRSRLKYKITSLLQIWYELEPHIAFSEYNRQKLKRLDEDRFWYANNGYHLLWTLEILSSFSWKQYKI